MRSWHIENILDRMVKGMALLKNLTVDGKGSYGIAASAVEKSERMYTYLRITDIRDDGTLNINEMKSVDDPAASKYILSPNDIVFARTGASTGRNYFYDGSDGIFVYAGFLIKFSLDPQKVNPVYVKYYCQSTQYRNWVKSFSTGSTRGNINAQTLGNMEIPLPSREQQNYLVRVLSPIDEKIKLNQKINDNLQQQAETLFKAWFIDFAPFDGIKPNNWVVYTLGEVTEMGAGGDKPKNTSKIKSAECPYPVYSNGLDNEGLYGYTDKAKIFDESVTVSARGTIGFVCLRHIPYVPIVRLVTLIPKESIPSAKYLYLYLKQLHISGTGTTQQQLTVPDFRKTEILIPDNTTMMDFTKVVTPIFNKIWANEDENKQLALIRDALLPKLMSGEIDVSGIQL